MGQASAAATKALRNARIHSTTLQSRTDCLGKAYGEQLKENIEVFEEAFAAFIKQQNEIQVKGTDDAAEQKGQDALGTFKNHQTAFSAFLQQVKNFIG